MPMRTAFVTGATGLLGNNLVRELVQRGWQVRALARSHDKAKRQLGDLAGVEIVVGDMEDVSGWATEMAGSDVLFHTAAHFRDSYMGGNHDAALHRVNVEGTRALLDAAYRQGLRRMVQTSSIAVLDGPRGAVIDETMTRHLPERDPYYRSKLLSDGEVFSFLDQHPDFFATFVLPGWMHGPGDLGPTQAGQTVLDFVKGRLPGVVPATFSFVDARDVALAQIAAAEHGRRGERYLVAGRHLTMADLLAKLESVSGVKAPTRRIPAPLLYLIACLAEMRARLTGKAALLSLATVRLMLQERDRSRFDSAKSETELGITFRPVEETLAEEIAWFRRHGLLEQAVPLTPAQQVTQAGP